MIQIPYDKMNFVWYDAHYDVHLSGLCKVNNRLYRFKVGTDYGWSETLDKYVEPIMHVYELTNKEKLIWLCRKWLFEICIGKHCSYPFKRKYGSRKPKWFWQIVFDLYYKFLAP